MDLHVDILATEVHSFKLQKLSLQKGSLSAGHRINEDLAPGPHDPLPGQPSRTSMHGPSHLASHVRSAHQSGNLAVGEDLARRNPPHNLIDLLEEGCLAELRTSPRLQPFSFVGNFVQV